MEGTGKPEYDKCVDISTKASLKANVITRYSYNWISNSNSIFGMLLP